MPVVVLFFLILFGAGVSGASPSSDAGWTWTFLPGNGPVQGVALVVHGLNTQPKKMNHLGRIFTEQDFEVLSVTLSGHGGSLENLRAVTREQWLKDLYRGYRIARAKADRYGVPLYFVGFSLGGLLGIDLLTHESFADVEYDRIVLLAPALAVRRTSRLVKFFKIFSSKFVLPSASELSYRANKEGTSVAAYDALFASLQALEDRDLTKAHVPALVVVDPKDELVSHEGLKEFIHQQGFSRWRLREIDNKKSYLKKSHRHLIIDYPSMGFDNWNLLRSWMLEFMGTNHGSDEIKLRHFIKLSREASTRRLF